MAPQSRRAGPGTALSVGPQREQPWFYVKLSGLPGPQLPPLNEEVVLLMKGSETAPRGSPPVAPSTSETE